MEKTNTVTIKNLKLKNELKVKAICNIVIDDMWAFNGIRIVKDKGRIIVAMPALRMPDGSYRDMCHPINPEARKIIDDAVIKEYRAALEAKEDAEWVKLVSSI